METLLPLPQWLMRLMLRLLIASVLIGLLIVRAWGWREYASPELYVVYDQLVQGKNQYFVVSSDDSSAGSRLRWQGGDLAKVDCSPDGRFFAFLTAANHLVVLTRAGLALDRAEDPIYTTVNVADDGSTALFDPQDSKLLLNDRAITLSLPDRPGGNEFDRIDLLAQDKLLWMRDFNDIQVVSPSSGTVTPYVSRGYSGEWLASGRMFLYSDNVTDSIGIGLDGGQYLMDMTTRMVAKIGDWAISRPLSPDGMKVAAGLSLNGSNHKTQIVVYNLFTDADRMVLTHDPNNASLPVCFLTFRPQMLIAGG